MKAAAPTDSSVSRHLVANVLGRAWAFLSVFLFVPAYLHLIGIANFGVITLFIAVAGLIAFLDMGLSPTIARELHDQTRSNNERLNLLFTYDITYVAFIAALVLFVLIIPISSFSLVIANDDLAKPEVASTVRLVFVAAALQLLPGFYVAGLMGIEEQIKGNLVIVGSGIVRSGIVIIPLWLWPTPFVYLLWQVIFILVFSAIARYFLYGSVVRDSPISEKKFVKHLLFDNLDFTRSMFLVAIASAVITQIDKLFISRMLGIASLAEYSLVWTFAQLLVFVISPITITLQPRFVRYASLDKAEAVRNLFLVTNRLVGAIVCATVATMVYFGPYLVHIWTVGNLEPDAISSYIVPMVIGHGLFALQAVPHSVAIANKNLRKILILSGVGALLVLPTYWYLIQRLGVAGAAVTWLMLQVGLYPLYIGWVNRRFIGLSSMSRDLFIPALLVPLVIALTINFVASQFISDTNSIIMNLLIIGIAAVTGVCSCLVSTLRRKDLNYLRGSVG